jgi:tRNA(adenine34) deaminase
VLAEGGPPVRTDDAVKFDSTILDRVFEFAEAALMGGERPVSALLVRDGEVVATTTDAVFERSDPTAHAERIVISDYCTANGLLHLRGFELYCFIEPCIMCCGAIHWAKLDRIVYALSQNRLKQLTGGHPKPGIRSYLPVGRHSPDVVGPVREDEGFVLASRYDWLARAL